MHRENFTFLGVLHEQVNYDESIILMHNLGIYGLSGVFRYERLHYTHQRQPKQQQQQQQ
jgi:hypothetical protein